MDYEERQRRLDRARSWIHAELALGFLAPVVVAFLLFAAPGTTGGPMFEPLWVTLLPWIGGAGVLVGLAWLVWLSRPNPERGEVVWRYRDF
jgi:hypothetical protein